MADLLRLIGAFAALFLIPFAVGLLLPKRELMLPCRWWFGTITLGLFLLLLHGLRTPRIPALILVIAALFFVLGKAFLQIRKYGPGLIAGRKHIPFFQYFVSFLFLLPLLISAYVHILGHPVSPVNWDAISLWYHRVKLLYHWIPLGNTPFVDWGTHINYPYLGPIIELFILRFTGGLFESYGRLLFPTFYFFWIFGLFYFHPEKGRWIFTAAVVVLGYLFFDFQSFTSGYQDGFVAVLAGMATLHFCRVFLKEESSSPGQHGKRFFDTDHFGAFFFAGSLCFVKTEGAVLSVLIVLAAGFTYYSTHNIRQSLRHTRSLTPYLLLFVALWILWPLLLAVNKITVTQIQRGNFSLTSIFSLGEHLERWLVITPYFASYFQEKSTILFSCFFLSALSAVFSPRSRRAIVFLWVLLAGHLIFIALPYFVTRINPFWHLKNSFSRLAFQHFFIYPLILVIASSFLADKIAYYGSLLHTGSKDNPESQTP